MAPFFYSQANSFKLALTPLWGENIRRFGELLPYGLDNLHGKEPKGVRKEGVGSSRAKLHFPW